MNKIGIDIGGTKMLCLGLDKNNNVIFSKKINTPKISKDDFYDSITSLVKECAFKKYSLGISFAGVVLPTGVIQLSANVPKLVGSNLFNELKRRGIRKPKIENDANCFAVGQVAKNKYNDLVGVIIGTGIGSGLILNGKLYTGFHGLAGEIGHGRFMNGFEYEDLLGGRTLDSFKIKGKQLDLWHENLSKMVCQILTFYNPEMIVFGGGLTNILDIALLKDKLKNEDVDIFLKGVKLKKDKDSTVMAIGAANL